MVKPFESIVTYYGQQINILIVDDQPINRQIIKDTFNRIDIPSKEACSVPHAIRLMKEEKFDLIITDLRMPGMDGYELAEIVKKKENPPLVYLCSADFFQIQKRSDQNINIDRVILKPVSSLEILDNLSKDFGLQWIYLGKAQDRDEIPLYKKSTGFPDDYYYLALDELDENYKRFS